MFVYPKVWSEKFFSFLNIALKNKQFSFVSIPWHKNVAIILSQVLAFCLYFWLVVNLVECHHHHHQHNIYYDSCHHRISLNIYNLQIAILLNSLPFQISSSCVREKLLLNLMIFLWNISTIKLMFDGIQS